MIKKLNNFLDKHRFFLVLVILCLVSGMFVGVNIYTFLNHKFEVAGCTKKKDSEICLHDNKEVFLDPEGEIKQVFQDYKREINNLVDEYDLPKFNYYTAYYYYLASNMDYDVYGRNETIKNSLYTYINTYSLEEFYKKNNFFYEIFYPYKLISVKKSKLI